MFIIDICDVSNFSELKYSFPSVGKEKENVRTYKAEAAYKVTRLTKNVPRIQRQQETSAGEEDSFAGVQAGKGAPVTQLL